MSNDGITLTLQKRNVKGKQVRALRRDSIIPAVIHNHGNDSIIVEAPLLDITKAYLSAGKHHTIDLLVGSEKYLAIIKSVDLDPRKNTLRHVVFDSLHQNEKVKTEVPIHLEGDSVAEKTGLMILPQLEVLEVEATPRNLPDKITVNIENLSEIGDKILVSDLKVPPEVKVLTDIDHPVVSVIETPAQQSEESENEAEEAPNDSVDTADVAKETSTEK